MSGWRALSERALELVELAGTMGSSLCGGCAPARDHVVSMQTGDGGSSLAICRCGWRSEVRGPSRHIIQDTRCRLHWHIMIRVAREARAA